MQSTQLLKICLNAFNWIPNTHGITPVPGEGGTFGKPHNSYDIAAAIGAYLRDGKGFTVILGYPNSDSGETYSSCSAADTWEEAVREIAEEMLAEKSVDGDDELSIVDVMEGFEHSTFPDVDRYAVVRFTDGKARILDSDAKNKEDYP